MKSILLGFDAFDPVMFEHLHNQGKMPHLSKFLVKSGYSKFRVSNPPQSEVSWTSIATGLNPGGHGLFDFVHRDPESYNLFVSLLPTRSSVLGTIFSPPHQAETIFSAAVKDGFPAMSLWWPATFPAQLGSPVKTIPGLGTPDIFGQLGVGISYSVESAGEEGKTKTRKVSLVPQGSGIYKGILHGPARQNSPNAPQSSLDFWLTIFEPGLAKLSIGKQNIQLLEGIWSPVIELKFNIGALVSVKAVTRAILIETKSHPQLYFTPLQLHPMSSPWPYGTPKSLLKKIWGTSGPYLTSGWPQDTTALEEGFLSDNQFLDLCKLIFDQRVRIFMSQLDSYKEGILACVFDSLDRIQHMFWKSRPDIIESWYLKLDLLAGQVSAEINKKTDRDEINMVVLSDHGFNNYNYRVHVNRWLINQGYLNINEAAATYDLSAVDWESSQAYAIGLNSVYLNLKGREKHGAVRDTHKGTVLETLKSELMAWSGPDSRPVFHGIHSREEAFKGPLSECGPDLVLGFNPGYRASSETGLGEWRERSLQKNTEHWEADHCFDAKTVPGVIFYNQGLQNFPDLSYHDIPFITTGKELNGNQPTNPVLSDEDQEFLRERLKGLGYL